jgi:septal ring factor EnvC (AmiA/AmiB activator)
MALDSAPELAARCAARAPLWLCLIVCFGTGLVVSTQTMGDGHDSAQIEARRMELRELTRHIDRLRAELDDEHAQRNQQRNRLDAIERDIVANRQRQRNTRHEIATHKTQRAELSERREEIKTQLIGYQDQLKKLIRASYLLGNEQYLKVLLSQQDPNSLGRIMTYYRYLAQSRAQQIQEVTALAEELHELDSSVLNKEHELARLNADLDRERQRLEAARTERADTLASITKDVQRKAKEVARLQANAARLSALVTKLQELAVQPPKLAPPAPSQPKPTPEQAPKSQPGVRFSSMKGRLPMPLRAKVRSAFGDVKTGSGMRWEGLLLAAAEGEPVHAIFDGRVVYADWLRGFGLLLILDHGDGYMSLYSHNSSLNKQLGDWVASGETIAFVGTTGGLSKPGLYFEVRYNGEPTNPLAWCRRG